MAWTYTDNPANVPADLVRYLIGDTVQKPDSPTDAIIAYWLGVYPTDTRKAASEVARHLGNQFSAMTESKGVLKIGGMSLPATDYESLTARYYNLAEELASSSEVSAGEINPGYVPNVVTRFSMGMMEG